MTTPLQNRLNEEMARYGLPVVDDPGPGALEMLLKHVYANRDATIGAWRSNADYLREQLRARREPVPGEEERPVPEGWFVPEGDARCGSVLVASRAICLAPRGHDGPHRNTQGYWRNDGEPVPGEEAT